MIRIPEPEHGGKYRLASKGRLGPTYDLAHKLGVSQHGQMPPCCSSAAMGKIIGVSRGKAANWGEVSSARYMEN